MRASNIPAHLLLTICLASGAAWAQPLPAAPGDTYFGGLLQVQTPPGWTAVRAPDALAFRAEQGDAAPIEIVSWDIPRGGDSSARSAAAAHESLLFERAPYRRLWADPVKAASGQEGLLVTGRLLGEKGHPRRTAFAAFACLDRYWVVGTFLDDGGPATTVPQVLRDLIGGLQFIVPVPVLAEPIPEPQPLPGQPLATPPAVAAGAPAAGPQPAALPPAPAPVLTPPHPTAGAPQPAAGAKPPELAAGVPPAVADGTPPTGPRAPARPTTPAPGQAAAVTPPAQPAVVVLPAAEGPLPTRPQPPAAPSPLQPALAPPRPAPGAPQRPKGLKPPEPATGVAPPVANGALPTSAQPASRPTTAAPEQTEGIKPPEPAALVPPPAGDGAPPTRPQPPPLPAAPQPALAPPHPAPGAPQRPEGVKPPEPAVGVAPPVAHGTPPTGAQPPSRPATGAPGQTAGIKPPEPAAVAPLPATVGTAPARPQPPLRSPLPQPALAPPQPATGTPEQPEGVKPPEPTPAASVPPAGAVSRVPAPPTGSLLYQSPLGFSFKYPAGWRVQLVGGRIEVTAPAHNGSALPPASVIIWPLARLRIGQDAAELGRALLDRCEVLGDGAARLQARQAEDLAVLSGLTGHAGGARRVVACCHVQRDHGLLTAVVARPDDFQERLPSLLQILSTFMGGPWWIELAAEPARTVFWHEPVQDRLRLPFPDDWRLQGQVRFMAGLPILSVDLSSRDGQSRCLWRQPLAPVFRELTPVLRNLGWQEGDRYPANARDDQLRVMPRLTPQDFLTRYWLWEGPGRLKDATLDRLTALAGVAGLAGATGSQGLVAELHGLAEGQARQRVCLVATGDAPTAVGPNCWQAAVLEAEAPPDALADAVAVLRAAVEGAAIGETTPEAEAKGLREALLAARTALANLPVPLQAQVTFDEVLAIRNDEGRGRLWLLAPQALAPWQQAAHALRNAERLTDGHSPGAALPELTPD